MAVRGVKVWLRKGLSEDGDRLTLIYADEECLTEIGQVFDKPGRQLGLTVPIKGGQKVQAIMTLRLPARKVTPTK